jgi:hypothetical protein
MSSCVNPLYCPTGSFLPALLAFIIAIVFIYFVNKWIDKGEENEN